MLKNKWADSITKEEVLEKIREKRTLSKNLKKRRAQMMGKRCNIYIRN